MNCPKCKSTESKVVDKRNNKELNIIKRRRECLMCSSRYTTFEKVESNYFLIKKKSGKFEEFDRGKLKDALMKGLKKRNISESQIDNLIEEVELALRNKHRSFVQSSEIGDEILKRLINIDQVAYLLYATVYLDFTNIDDFIKEIEKLKTITNTK